MPRSRSKTRGPERCDVTIAVCTRDRAHRLGRLLGSLTRLRIPRGTTWSVLISDNGSTDRTPEVLAEYARRLPLTVVREEHAGVARARNAVLDHVNSRWMACTDDDVSVPPGWLDAILRAFKRYPQAGFVAGDIHAVFPGMRDSLRKAVLEKAPSAFAAFAVGEKDIRVDAGSPAKWLPYGANIAFVTDEIRGRRFDVELGRQPGDLFLGGEETRFVHDYMRDGGHGWLVAGNPVLHWIGPERQTIQYIERFYYGQGWQSGIPQLVQPLSARLGYHIKMRTLRAAWPLIAPFASERRDVAWRRALSEYRGALDGRREPGRSKLVAPGIGADAELT